MNIIDFKVVLIGKAYTGKTSLAERYLYDQFSGENTYKNTIGAAFHARRVEVSGKKYTVGLWDTSGDERYDSIARIYFRKTHAAIVCYDLTDAATLERAKLWITELWNLEEKCFVFLCGTKKDLINNNPSRRALDVDTVKEYAQSVGAEFCETSSKTGEGVKELFQKLVEKCVYNRIEECPEATLSLQEERPKEKSCCH